MSPPVLHLPFDPTGEAVTNKVTAELHIVAATGTRAFVPSRGSYFTRGMVLRNQATGLDLTPDVDYRPVHMNIDASLRVSEEVNSVVLILPTCNATQVEMDYQAIGGEYSTSVSAIEQLLESLDLDNRTIHWGDIINPPEYFPPTSHPHDVGDLYGFEYVVAALLQISRAILLGDQAAFDELRQYVDMQDTALRNLFISLETLFDEHINNTSNPHNTTKAQVGLSNVDNYATANQAQAEAGTANNLFMTPLRTAQLVAAIVGDTINAHIANTNNPHNTTKAQVGLSNVGNYPVATQPESEAGTAFDRYMTPGTTKWAIDFFVLGPLTTHINNVSNPHSTTKTQVGLGNVDNYATATLVQAEEGTANNLFMTPATTRALVDAVVGTTLSDHISNTSNPHSTTKAQVGLGNVQDYGMASTLDAENGGSTELYMSPGTTRNAIIKFAVQPLNTHIADVANPHGTTKAQVGLSNVLNYPIASQAEAELGTSNVHYMTALRSRNAIEAIAVAPLTTLINQRVTTGSNGQLASLTIGTEGYLYQEVDGATTLRVSNTKFTSFKTNGDVVVGNGKVIASGGFRPSDRRLKQNIEARIARRLWREVDWKQWDMIETGEHQIGLIAQNLRKAAPDLVTEFEHGVGKTKKKRLAIDNTGTALEMAYAAGEEIDVLKSQVEAQEALIVRLATRLAKLEEKA